MSYPRPIQSLIDAFKLLPGVGPRTAERYAFGLLKRSTPERDLFIQALKGTISIRYCEQCYNFADQALCTICADSRRLAHTVCVVADVQDLGAIERTGEFKGVYHVLGGLLAPLEGVTPEDIKIKQLLARIEKVKNPPHAPPLQGGESRRPSGSSDEGGRNTAIEIILAFDQTPEGESTSIYLAKILKETGARVMRLARGLPTGSDLNYADEMTLSSALSNRKEL